MEIRDDQRRILESFICERISGNEQSEECIKNFVSERGKLLVSYLQKHGLEEDSSGITAFYIVRNSGNLPLAFFSLKCGELFSPFYVEELTRNIDYVNKKINIISQPIDFDDVESMAIYSEILDIVAKKNCSVDDARKIKQTSLKCEKKIFIERKSAYHADKKTEENMPIIRVDHTYSGIEIVQFCIDDAAVYYWEQLRLHHTMGEVIFWYFIVPILEQVQKVIGCQYAYLFAADSTDDRTLVNYYKVTLKFIKPIGIGTVKPEYDYRCEFLAQEINKLLEHRKLFFENFNFDQDDIFV